ncbi:MAG: molybdate ABC transporter substrate-binding protein [Acidimicrobiia bacterium]|nr:molybdate ABC transporter substrate-binding protein [Acidimicrobiia bacterium]
MTRRRDTFALLLPLLAVLGCGGGESGASAPGLDGDITVLAAASLTDAFTALGATFEARHPETGVELQFGPSSGLVTQITEGAPADVFASASTSQMDAVVGAGANEGEPEPFATNVLQIAVPPGNPGGVAGLDAFGRDELLLGLCAEEVPCGQFGRAALSAAGITPAVDTEEPDVRALLTKVESGELDAGLVYETDVLASDGGVEGVEIPEGSNVVATYPLVALADAEEPEVAAAFVELVLSEEGLEVLQDFGFRAP